MATIASWIADLGVDPAGVKAGLDKAGAYVKQFAKTADANLENTFEKTNRSVSSLTTRIIQLATALGAAFAIKAGIDFNRTMETAELGIASLITAQAQLRDRSGNLLEGTNALTAAQAIAADQMRALRIAGIQTAATTEELVAGFQQAVGVGLRWGLTLEQIRKITIGITQAAGALGVPMNQLNEEIRDLLAGNINARNTRVATALGISNEDIRNARETGQLAEFVLGRLKAFNVAGAATAQTWAGVLSNIREAFSLFMGDALKPAFESVKLALNTALAEAFDLDNATISQKFAQIVAVAQKVFGGIGDVLAKGIAMGVNAAKEFNEWLVENRATVDEILKAFGFIAAEVGSLVGDALKLVIALVAAAAETGILKTIFYTISLFVALIHTAFEGLLVVFATLGKMVLNVLLKPIVWLAQLIGKIVGLIDKDMAVAFEGVAAWGNEFLDGISKGVEEYTSQVAAGNALDRWVEKVQAADTALEKVGKTAKKTAEGITLTANAGGVSLDDQIKDLEQLTGRLVTLHNSAEKAGTLTSAFSGKVAEAMLTAERLLAGETDKLSDNTVRLTIVLDKLREAYLGFSGQLPGVSVARVNLSSVPAMALSDAEKRSGRTSVQNAGKSFLNGVRGMPGFVLPTPTAAPTPAPTSSPTQIRFNAAMSVLADGASKAASGLWNVVRSGGLQILSSILSQLSPFGLIVKALSDAMKPLEPVLAALARIIVDALLPVFEALAPIIQAFIPFFRALLQIIAPLVRALLPILTAFVPILEALFPVIKFAAIALTYLIQAAALASSILLRFVGNIIIVIGSIFLALAKAIDALPGVGAKHAIDVAQGVIDFGKGMLNAADAFKKTADSMDDVRKEINGTNIDHTVDSLDDLGDAAAKTAATMLNVPTWFKIAGARFRAADPTTTKGGPLDSNPWRRRFSPTLATTAGDGGAAGSAGGSYTFTGDILIDARSLSASELFDVMLSEGKKRARAQGVGTWSEVH